MIHQTRINPPFKLHFSFSLCRLQCHPHVRLINEIDVIQLENKFMMGYCDNDQGMYVSLYNNLDEVLHVP